MAEHSPDRRATAPRALIFALVFALVEPAGQAVAGVVRLVVDARSPLADGHEFGNAGAYERITGRLFLDVDHDDPANERIHDLALAPRNDWGRVEFSTDFLLFRPADPCRGNRRLFFEANNRGNMLALNAFNDRGNNATRTLDDTGNAFLFRRGYAVLSCGWNGDVRPGEGRLTTDLPVARDEDQPIEGRIHAEISVDAPSRSEPLSWGNTAPYPVVDPDSAEVTMRPSRDATAVAVPRERWAFARVEGDRVEPDPTHLFLEDGFRPGWLYDVVYTTRDPRVTGLGFAAVRDVVSFFRHVDSPENPLSGTIDGVLAFGISQSGRFLHHFVHEGFNLDEEGRPVFDGVLAHVAGGGKGFFNGRFVQTTRHGSPHQDQLFPSEIFPMATVSSTDPITGRSGDSLERARAAGSLPRLMFTNTSAEYWTRAASLLHTDVEGRRDLGHDPRVRIYLITGGQHFVTTDRTRDVYTYWINTLDHRPALRALLVALDDWATRGVEPPPSRYPRIDDGTLIDADSYRAAFPAIPGVVPPRAHYTPTRLNLGPRWESDGIIDQVPAIAGLPFPTLIPAPDADGNDRAGIRLPDVAVPLKTLTGWNPRSSAAGAEGVLGKFHGSELPFARSAEERAATGDPRPSVLERYPTFDRYLGRVAETALGLEADGYLLDEDVVRILREAGTRRSIWDDPPRG